MKRILVALMLVLGAPAMACAPPPGLQVQPWYAYCGGELEMAYGRGAFNNMPYNAFVAMVYRQYVASWAGGAGFGQPQPISPMPYQTQPIGPQQCSLGASQCFNGWFRTCQRVGNGTMWITGSQRC